MAKLWFIVFALVTLAFGAPAQAQGRLDGTDWTGYWSWTSCPPVAHPNCSLTTQFDNIHLILRQSDPTHPATVTGIAFPTDGDSLSGTLAGNQFNFTIDYHRSDITGGGTCDAIINGTSMTGNCVDHYNSGPGGWRFVVTCSSCCSGSVAKAVHLSVTSDNRGNAGTRMSATFTPNFGLSLDEAAAACQVSGFNWQQTLLRYPTPDDLSDCHFTIFPEDNGPGLPVTLCTYANNAPNTPLIAPYSDPPVSGYTYEFERYGIIDDAYPYYCGSADFETPPVGTGGCLDADPTRTLRFSDVPGDLALNLDILQLAPSPTVPTGNSMEFITQLVGVKGNVAGPGLFSWSWKSNNNRLGKIGNGGVFSVTKNLDGGEPGSGTGGVTITSINGVIQVPPIVTCSATPTNLWPPNGKSVLVTVSGTVSSGTQIIDASSPGYVVTDAYGLVQPRGAITVRGDGKYSFGVWLVASRSGNDKNGRTYTIVVSSRDVLGNPGSCSTVVIVPHDQSG